ncbi:MULTISPECIES: excalibur calcium-binding domain-containing protein [Nostoc]
MLFKINRKKSEYGIQNLVFRIPHQSDHHGFDRDGDGVGCES